MRNYHLIPFAALLPLLACCAGDIAGFSRGERWQIYGAVLEAAGHPEIGKPVGAAGRRLARLEAKQPRNNIQPGSK